MSSWTELVEARAASLLAAHAAAPALVVAGPADAAPAAELARVCRQGGVVAWVAPSGALGALGAVLADAGCAVERVIPFDALGPGSPWAASLGARATRVAGELESHLEAASVREAAALLEREVTALLPPETAGQAVVVARRGGARAVESVSLAERLADPDFRSAIRALAQDDAVIRFAAFLDAEVLSAAEVGFSVARWLEAVGDAPPAELRAGLWRWPGFETYRFLQAAGHRTAARVAAALAEDAAAPAGLAPTLVYDLVETLNALADHALATEEPWTG